MGLWRWDDVSAIARRQYGLVTRGQLLLLGASPDQIKGWIAAGRIEVVHRSVYRLAGVPSMPEGATLAAVLGAGDRAAASHASAAWLWGLVPEPPLRPEVIVPVQRAPRLHGAVVHRTHELPDRFVRRRRGIPSVDPLLAMLQLGASLPRLEVADALERGLMSKLFTVAALEWVRAELAAQGRNGCGVLGSILDDRALGRDRPDGMLEPRMAQVCARFGLERPVFQYVVRDAEGRFVAKVDFAYVDVRAFLEVDGYETHGTPEAMEADFDRQNRLVALGWVPIRFGWRRLVRQPRTVASQVHDVLATLRAT
jgi:hypothetical protein